MAETTRTPISFCKCGVPLDCATGTRQPLPGDYSMCVECFEILRFDENLLVRSATSEELAEMPEDMKAQFLEAALKLGIMKNVSVLM